MPIRKRQEKIVLKLYLTGRSDMENKIELVHFQITKNCNLRCWFCGQWGKKGFFSDIKGKEMAFEDWEKAVKELVDIGKKTKSIPDVILWGGEPLLSPFFEELVFLLKSRGFNLGLITNGTLMDQYAVLLKQEFQHIYISLDGDRAVHNRIRGEGIYEKVTKNMELIRGGNAVISITTVISPDNLSILENLPEIFSALPCDEILLQEMISLSGKEGENYKHWAKECFNQEATEIDAWINGGVDQEKKKKILETLLEKNYPKPVRYLPHGVEKKYCKAPWKHLHIAWNGDLLYCTDFYDCKVGNVRNKPIRELVENDASNRLRKEIQAGNCVTCKHCSWRNNESFRI